MKFNKLPKLKYIIICVIPIILLIPFLLLILATQISVAKFPSEIKPTEEFCIEGHFFLPRRIDVGSSVTLETRVEDIKTIFNNLDIYAKRICIIPTVLLSEKETYDFNIAYTNKINFDVFKKQIEITTEGYPEVTEKNFNDNINPNQTIQFEIDYTSDLLEYSIVSVEASAPCIKDSLVINCDITSFNMQPGSDYELILVAKHNENTVEEVTKANINILTPVEIVSSSISSKEVIQSISIPNIEIVLNKEINPDYQILIKDADKVSIENESSLVGMNLNISPKENFKQNTRYFLKISGLSGIDGSNMPNEYILEFAIGDGPKVEKTNLINGFDVGNNVVITLSQEIKSKQDIKSFIKFDPSAEYSYSISKNQITINPKTSLSSCKNYKITINKGITSNNELISSEDYSKQFKTTCKRIVNIGTSVQGRAIYASYFGAGPEKIVFFGSMHGSEANTKVTMDKLINELENKSNNIPTNKTIIAVPTFNPDGVANKTRFNANGVDLNRNFPSSTWTQETFFLNNSSPNGGGLAPLSEPESVAIKNLITKESPYLAISYHSAAGYVIPTNTTKAIELGKIYTKLSNYKYIAPGTKDAFSYSIIGTFELWAEENGYNAIVIELSSASADQFSKNVSAMWEMIKN